MVDTYLCLMKFSIQLKNYRSFHTCDKKNLQLLFKGCLHSAAHRGGGEIIGISHLYSEFVSGSAGKGPAERLCHLGPHKLLQQLHAFHRSDGRSVCRKELLTICRRPAKERFGIQKEHLLAEMFIWHADD